MSLFPYVFDRAQRDEVRNRLRRQLKQQLGRNPRLDHLADTFAWGIRKGRELTGTVFRIDMPGDESLGYTRLNENRVWITPLLIMRMVPNSVEATKGLIVHEYGHHLYHKEDGGIQVWDRAANEGLGELLNLVADEHLERRLRSESKEYGDYLKMLGAYAFQRADKTVSIQTLLETLGNNAAGILFQSRLRVARRHGCVTIDNGQVLTEMERSGMSFARFFRALRLGLGNRYNDPKVAEGLALFKGKFRQLDMENLYEITRKLHKIFGNETQALVLMGEMHDANCDSSEIIIRTGGLTGDELQSEINRVMRGEDPSHEKISGGSGVRLLNDGVEEAFSKITTVQPMDYDPVEAKRYIAGISRPARKLREYFEKLGLNYVSSDPRVAGHSLDRSRLRALVTRGEPRILRSRELRFTTDLFLGVVIDCSGSMSYGDHMEEAKHFGMLLAEATKGLRGIDARFFGFTDSVIYDAGSANRCAVHGLEFGGGNNDAAALWHAATIARESRRRAKVLVMISDGLPTECSTTALRSLVTQLTKRHGMCCAQVAVQPLEEICFPHYVEILGMDETQRVIKFGRIVAGLVNRALS